MQPAIRVEIVMNDLPLLNLNFEMQIWNLQFKIMRNPYGVVIIFNLYVYKYATHHGGRSPRRICDKERGSQKEKWNRQLILERRQKRGEGVYELYYFNFHWYF